MNKPNEGISVDGACQGNPGRFEYRAVDIKTGEELFELGRDKLYNGTNNIAEFLALVHCLAYCNKSNIIRNIYSDSKTAMAWVKNGKANTSFNSDKETAKLLVRAESYLKNNKTNSSILKWKTKLWGEIPADYDRK